MKDERTIAGLRCGQVLEQLSAYLDGELQTEQKAGIEAHVRNCELCTRFGGAFSAAISGLRRRLLAADDLPPDVASRLSEALRRAR